MGFIMNSKKEFTTTKYIKLREKYQKSIATVCRTFYYLDKDDLNSIRDFSLWQCYLAYNPKKGNFGALLRKYMYRQCCRLVQGQSAQKRRGKQVYLPLNDIPSRTTDNLINQVPLNSLPPYYKEVINSKLEGRSDKEISRTHNKTEQAISQAKRIAIKKLKDRTTFGSFYSKLRKIYDTCPDNRKI